MDIDTAFLPLNISNISDYRLVESQKYHTLLLKKEISTAKWR